MPFKSVAQRNFMHAKKPGIAKRFDADAPKGARLPYKVGGGPISKLFAKGKDRK